MFIQEKGIDPVTKNQSLNGHPGFHQRFIFYSQSRVQQNYLDLYNNYPMQKKIIITMLAISILFSRCSQEKGSRRFYTDGFGTFDIKQGGDQLLFSFTIKGKSALYKSGIDTAKAKPFIAFKNDLSVFKPRYSPDGKKIVFISDTENSQDFSLWMINVDGSGLIHLAKGLITEGIFSFNNNYIYFTKAKVYERFSPLASKGTHDFDVYRIDLKDKRILKITNLNAYKLSNIIDLNEEKMILDMCPEGTCIYNKATNSILTKISPVNNKDRAIDSYSTPVLINHDLISLVSYYELIGFNLSDRKEQLIFSTEGAHQFGTIRFLKEKNSLVFSYSGSDNVLYSVDLAGKGIRQITLQVNK